MSSDVTVIMPTFNRATYIAESLDSLLAQTVLPSQIIVVDDGSTDGTSAALAPYHGRIDYLRQDNGGKPAAINGALPLVRGRYLWVFDDDDIACPDALARHLRALESRPDAGWSYGGFYTWPHVPGRDDRGSASARPPRPFAPEQQFRENLFSCYLPSPAVVVRTEVQRAAGPYREDLLRSEDFEMSVRWALVAPGVRISESERPTYFQRQHGGARGPQGQQYPASELRARERNDSRKALRGLAAQLTLEHYLPLNHWGQPLDQTLRAQALLWRWGLHMQKGMWPEALQDGEALAAEPLVSSALAAEATRVAQRVFVDRFMMYELAADSAAMRAVGRLLAQDNLRCLRMVGCRHLYYRLRADFDARRHRDLRAVARVAAGVFGILGFPRILLGDRAARRRATVAANS